MKHRATRGSVAAKLRDLALEFLDPSRKLMDEHDVVGGPVAGRVDVGSERLESARNLGKALDDLDEKVRAPVLDLATEEALESVVLLADVRRGSAGDVRLPDPLQPLLSVQSDSDRQRLFTIHVRSLGPGSTT